MRFQSRKLNREYPQIYVNFNLCAKKRILGYQIKPNVEQWFYKWHSSQEIVVVSHTINESVMESVLSNCLLWGIRWIKPIHLYSILKVRNIPYYSRNPVNLDSRSICHVINNVDNIPLISSFLK